MTGSQYAELVESLEQYSNEQPTKYKWKVGGLAALGYFYIWFWLLVSVVVTIAMAVLILTGHANYGVLKGVFLFALFSFYVIKSLWVKHEPPEGKLLTESDAPALFEMIQDIKNQIKTPKIHKVIVTNEFNAAISQVPRLGVLGFYKNYLILGLPMMQGTSPEEFKAIMAHELAHLSKEHGRFSGWIYRVRASWFRLIETLEQKESWGQFLFKKFFKWFVPRFNAYSFVLARENEYVADRESARVAGSNVAGSALVRISTTGGKLYDDFWRPFYLKAYDQKECLGPYSLLKEQLKAHLSDKEKETLLNKELLVSTGYSDTHPSLQDRLDSIGAANQTPAILTETAASKYFGEYEDVLVAELDKEWIQFNQENWRKKYYEGQELKEELEKVAEPTTVEEADKKLQLVERLHGTPTFVETYFDVRKQVPAISEIYDLTYYVASIILHEGDERAVELLEEAKDKHWEVKLKSLNALRYYYTLFGTEEDVKNCEDELDKWYYVLEQADEEKSTFYQEDSFQLVEDAELETFYASILDKDEDATAGYLFKRELKTIPGREIHYLVVDYSEYLWKSDMEKLRTRLLEGIDFPYETAVGIIPLEPAFKEIVDGLEGCQIFKKEKKKKKRKAS